MTLEKVQTHVTRRVISMRMWVLTTRPGRMLSEDKKTLILKETEGVCYSFVPTTNCA